MKRSSEGPDGARSGIEKPDDEVALRHILGEMLEQDVDITARGVALGDSPSFRSRQTVLNVDRCNEDSCTSRHQVPSGNGIR